MVAMVVDDVSIVAPGFDKDTKLREFDTQYRETLADLGFQTKDPDPLGFKAFQRIQEGEVLGFVLNTRDLTWSLSREKNDKILEQIEKVYDKTNLKTSVPITLKEAQKTAGKLQAICACWTKINIWLMFITRDITLYLQKYPDRNKLKESAQKNDFKFSYQARTDLHFLRAVLCHVQHHWIPITNPDKTPPAMADVVVYTDASGKIDGKPEEPGPALGILIPPQPGTIARAVSFPLPLEFLKQTDDLRHNYGNTILLEGLGILACLLRFPNTFKGKTAVFYTDSTGFTTAFQRSRTKGYYNAYLLRNIMLVTEALDCKLTVTWQRRRSTNFAAAADTLTHQSFEDVPPAIQYQRVESLPEPIHTTLVTSLNFQENSFHKMWQRILKYWYLQ